MLNVIIIIIAALLIGRARYALKTQDLSIQGYIEYLKTKYYYKKDDQDKS